MTPPDLLDQADLPELLRRCHREELLRLAAAVGVNPAGLGLQKLAGVIAGQLRRQGGHALANLLLRRGEGPTYAAILTRLSQGAGNAPGTIEAMERGLLRGWAQAAWERLSAPQRAALAQALDLPELPSEPPDVTTLTVRGRAGELVPWGVGLAVQGPLKLLLLPLYPLLGPLLFLWLGRARDEALLPAVLEVARLRQVLQHRVTVGVVGSPSSGKDAAIAAIFQVHSGNISPIAGSTRSVSITRLPSSTALFVVNTPGMGDVIEAVTEEARQVLDHIDLYLYVINAQGGVQARERADWQRCVASGRPVLAVVNKIDTLLPEDQERFLADARQKLGAAEADFLGAAFDPLPQLADAPINLPAVQAWIEARLVALGKDRRELPWVSHPQK